jgi:tetratricopeptide (TPR) repeat protein
MPFFEVWATITGLVCLAAVIYGIMKFSRQNEKLAVWGLVWFFAFTVPPMFFRAHIIGIGFEYFEYRSYIPFIGILLVLGVLAARLPHGYTFPKLLKIVIPITLLYTALAYAHTSDFADPMSFYSTAVKSNPQNVFALSERGSAYLKENNVDRAVADYDTAIKLEPEFSTPYYNKGAMYRYMQDHQQAEYYFSLALKYDTLHTEARNPAEASYYNLSLEKLSLKKYDEVLTICTGALEKYPAYSGFYNIIAQVYEVQGKHDDAIAMYTKAITYDSANAEYFSNRGVAKYHLNNNTDAIRDFNRALEVNPNYADALVNRAVVKLITQDNDGAYMDLSNAAMRKPNMAIIYYYRGVALMNMKKPDAARADWQKSAELGNHKAAEILSQSSGKVR